MKFNKMNRAIVATLIALCASSVGMAANAETFSLWNEDTDGDLSDLGFSPTQLKPLSLGSNLLRATFNAGSDNPSPDYFTIDIPEGQVLTHINLLEWEAKPTFEDIAFMAVQEGTSFTFEVPEDRSNAKGLLGWTHLRSTQVGSNKVLTELSTSNLPPSESGAAASYKAEAKTYPAELLAADPGLPDRLIALGEQWVPGAKGFETPLGAGKYSFWLRQGSDTNITTEFDFKTALAETEDAVSTPEPLSLIALGVVSGAGLLLKRRQA